MRSTILLAASFSLLLTASSRAQNTVFFDDFENGSALWTLTGNARLVDPSDVCGPVVAPIPSGTHFIRFGVSQTTCSFESGGWVGTATFATPLVLPAGMGSIDLSFATNSEGEDWTNGDWDTRHIEVSADGGPWTRLSEVHSSPWYRHVYDLTSYGGRSVLVRFVFDAIDGYGNQFRGWFLDDVAVTSRAEPGVPFCFGDWCPCSNAGTSGNGCATSINAAGGNLASSGMASVSTDSVVLTASGLSNSVVTFFQGTSTGFEGLYYSGAFGDGRRCASGSVIRLKAALAQGGVAQFPAAADQPVSVRGMIPMMGGYRSYQVWYRNAASFCTPATYNLTNGLVIPWRP
jgi:hypothetical protein